MELKERVKAVRKSQPKMTQAQFGSMLGATREMITSYEIGKVTPSDAFIKLICATYGISYSWLKDGIGAMYREPDSDDELVDNIMFGDNEFAKDIMKRFARLSDDHWVMLREVIEALKKGKV